MLIEDLHGQYSDARELAIVQLVLLGDKSVKPLLAYLEKEERMQAEWETQNVQRSGFSGDPHHEEAWIAFRENWGHFPSEYVAGKIADARINGIEGALKALSLLGRDDEISRLVKLLENIRKKNSENRWP
jgi:hypothetical protein